MRVVFMGSPEFALPSLRRLLDASYEVAGVVTQPDRESGRGRKLTPPPVKTLALERGLPVLQPPRLRRPEAIEQVAALRPDLIVVAAYGQILPPAVLAIPAHGCVNVHASLLPRWRGAAPVVAAILAGDTTTGVSIMQIDEGLDTGPVLTTRPVAIAGDDTAGTLTERLAHEGADLLVETLPPYLNGLLATKPQDDTLATYAPPVRKDNARLDLTLPARDLWLRVRAYHPWPVARAYYKGEPLFVHRARPLATETPAAPPPGTVIALTDADAPVGVVTGDGVLALLEVQRPGRRPLPAAEFVRGERDFIGSVLG